MRRTGNSSVVIEETSCSVGTFSVRRDNPRALPRRTCLPSMNRQRSTNRRPASVRQQRVWAKARPAQVSNGAAMNPTMACHRGSAVDRLLAVPVATSTVAASGPLNERSENRQDEQGIYHIRARPRDLPTERHVAQLGEHQRCRPRRVPHSIPPSPILVTPPGAAVAVGLPSSDGSCGTARRLRERRLLTWEGWANGDQRQTVQMLSCPDLPRDAAAGGLIQDDAKAARCAATAAMRAPDA
jgi:hypothetical protein